jgi:peptidoglycan/xylan/chitin deacetylase (PgdA/CDA1 family)
MARTALFLLLFCVTNASLALLYPFSLAHFLLETVLYGAGTGVTLYLLFYPRSQWLVDNRSQVERDGCVALTFDDGPDPVDTPRLLDLLREKNVKATFFVVGQRAERHPEIVRRAWDEGHLIANHTWSHRSLFCFLLPQRLRTEIEGGSRSIERICGIRTRYFRSPVGLRHPLLRFVLQMKGLEYISWRVRSYDTTIRNSGVLSRHVLRKVVSRDIILMHDHRPKGARVMLEALPAVIDELKERGFEFVLAGSRESACGSETVCASV